MSFNRENIAWQSKSGLWNLGFYTVLKGWDDGSDDYDPEWDVDYDFERFEWVSTGHPTYQAASDSWDGANPGCTTIVEFTEENTAQCAALDQKAARLTSKRPTNQSFPPYTRF